MHTQSDSSSEAERSQLRLLARCLWGTSNAWRAMVAGRMLVAVLVVMMTVSYSLLALSLGNKEPLQINEATLAAGLTVAYMSVTLLVVLLAGWAVRWAIRYRRGDGDMVLLEMDRLSTAEQWVLRAFVVATLVFGVVFAITVHDYAAVGLAASMSAGLCLVILDEVRYSRERRRVADHG